MSNDNFKIVEYHAISYGIPSEAPVLTAFEHSNSNDSRCILVF